MKLLLILSMAFFSVTTFAGSQHCELHSVEFVGHANALKYKVEEILFEKGYGVISDGELYETKNVPVSDLKIRPDLIVPGNYILIDYEMGLNFSSTACEIWSDDLVNCSAQFTLYYINENRRFVKLANIKEDSRPKITIFRSANKINKDFAKNVIEKVRKAIPECK